MKSYREIVKESASAAYIKSLTDASKKVESPKKPFKVSDSYTNVFGEDFEMVVAKDKTIWFRHEDMYSGNFMEIDSNWIYQSLQNSATPFVMNKEEKSFYLSFIEKNAKKK